jgi:hypothetical protein
MRPSERLRVHLYGNALLIYCTCAHARLFVHTLHAGGLHRLCRKARDRQVHRVTIAREEIRRRLSMQNRAKL